MGSQAFFPRKPKEKGLFGKLFLPPCMYIAKVLGIELCVSGFIEYSSSVKLCTGVQNFVKANIY